MANVYKTSLLQIRPQWTPNAIDGHIPECVLWYVSGSADIPDATQLTEICTIFDDNFSDVWSVAGPTTMDYTGSVVTDWSSDAGLSYDSVGVLTEIDGTLGGGPLPANVAILISWNILVRYKGGHPRTYLPYPAVDALDGGQNDTITAGVQGDINEAIVSLNSAMIGSGVLGGQTQNIYRFRNDAEKAELYEITSFDVQRELASQRRRLRRVTRT